MERNLAIHILDKLVQIGLMKESQVNSTSTTFVQEEIQKWESEQSVQIAYNHQVK